VSTTLTSTTTLAAHGPLDHVLPHVLFELGPVTVTNHMFMLTVAAALTVLLLRYAARHIAVTGNQPADFTTKNKFAHVIEVLLIFLREEMTRPSLGHLTEKYIGYIWTTFFFILSCNLVGLFPLAEFFNVLFGLEHLGGTPTGNINVTAALAVVSFFMMQYVGIKEQGTKYFAHFAPVPFSSPLMVPLALLLVILEIVGSFVKPFALCMRLFANMLAGHMVLASLMLLIFLTGNAAGYFLAVPVMAGSLMFMLLEIFVAFLQAYIFTFLTVLFIAQGAVHHDEEHEHEPHDENEHLGLEEGMARTSPEMAAL